jgi:hypothetical protein
MNLKSYFKSKTKKKNNREPSNSSLMNNNSTLYLLFYTVYSELQRYKKFTRRRVAVWCQDKWKATKRQKKGTQSIESRV